MQNMVFITGATGGLGKAFAVECASRRWDLFLTDLDADRLEMLAMNLKNTYGVKVMYQPCDLTAAASREHLFDTLRADGLRFQALINVAGLDYEGLFCERSRDEIGRIVRLNIEATLGVTHALMEHMDSSKLFRIIMVSSLAAFFPMPVKATYAASKRFLLDFSLALRDELRSRGATVTVLCPAGLPTTPECIQAIEAQGLMGQLTTQNIGSVAARTLDDALKGRAVYIPGFLNQVLQILSSLVPPVSLAELLGRRWRAAHQRRKEMLDAAQVL
ncbi:MAG: SDR family NAD(P)-dependent oxidoreductase [Chloroflexota bacterium]